MTTAVASQAPEMLINGQSLGEHRAGDEKLAAQPINGRDLMFDLL